MYNTKLVDNLNKRKLFKKHIFHNNNIEEEYYWDDYDTTYGYKMNTQANCLIGVKKTTIHSATPCPTQTKATQTTHCLPSPQIKKILLSNTSSQTTNTIICNSSTQTQSKLYFNLNFYPFNTQISFSTIK